MEANPTIRVILGSGSYIKKKAVENGLKAAGIVCNVFGIAVPSGVRPQPIGKAETEQGALFRAQGARKEKDGDLFIGIENGMWKEGGNEVDGACIVFLKSQEQPLLVAWSDVLVIPPLEERLGMGIGIGPNQEWSEHKDPHSIVTKGVRSRAMFLSDAVQRAVEENDMF